MVGRPNIGRARAASRATRPPPGDASECARPRRAGTGSRRARAQRRRVRNADALRLLSSVRTADSLTPVARVLGFDGTVEPLGRDAAAALARASGVRAARTVAGAGGRRALIAETDAPPH